MVRQHSPVWLPFPAGSSRVSVSALLEKNLSGGCRRLKAPCGKLSRLDMGCCNEGHWTGDFSTAISSYRPGKVTADKHRSIHADITLPRALKWSKKPVVFHTCIGRTDRGLQCPPRGGECGNWFPGVLGTDEDYNELERPAPSTAFGCTVLINLSLQAHLSLIEVPVHEKRKAGTAFA